MDAIIIIGSGSVFRVGGWCKMNLVFSFDENYIPTFKVLLHSIYLNNPEEKINIYILHYEMKESALEDLKLALLAYNYNFFPINCKDFLEQTDNIIINRYYTIEMYLWLFAPYILPKEVERALYLDPDIINLNNIQRFYDLDFEDQLFIAMDYKIKNKIIQPFNNLRLGTRWAEHYFNAGVVLMNIEKLRQERNPDEIAQAVLKNKALLILPDQDIFNYLYQGEIKSEEWQLYNVDPRLYQLFQFVLPETYNLDWVEKEVVFIHYAGRNKPWLERENYKMDLGKYYFKYEEQLIKGTKESEREVLDDKTF